MTSINRHKRDTALYGLTHICTSRTNDNAARITPSGVVWVSALATVGRSHAACRQDTIDGIYRKPPVHRLYSHAVQAHESSTRDNWPGSAAGKSVAFEQTGATLNPCDPDRCGRLADVTVNTRSCYLDGMAYPGGDETRDGLRGKAEYLYPDTIRAVRIRHGGKGACYGRNGGGE